MSSYRDLFSVAEGKDADQIKLGTLSVYNWGSFQGLHSISISENGTLITGENGAGKSTIIDGLMILLRPAHNAGFNMAAAQGDKSDRSIVSYMRGSYGRELSEEETQVSKNLRNGAVVSVIKAVYYHTLSDKKVVLMGVFYINSSSCAISDVKRLYVVGETDISIKDVLSNFSNHDARSLKNYLKIFPDVRVCDNNFSEYMTHFRHKLHMENSNAPALLSRAMGLKKIDDLTNLIRTLVLEPGEIKKDAAEAVKQFEDLKITHERLVDAREQKETLDPLRNYLSEMEKNEENVQKYTIARESLEGYAASVAVDFYKLEINKKSEIEEQLKVKEKDILDKKNEIERQVDIYHENYLKNGGDAIEKFGLEIRQKELDLERVTISHKNYLEHVKYFDLPIPSTEEEFINNYNQCSVLENNIHEKDEVLVEKISNLGNERKILEEKSKSLKTEILDLEKHPESNIDIRYQNLRNEISKELEISQSDLLYVAELMEVKPKEKHWHGAIERALGGIRHTLLVSEDNYRSITKWLNARHTGLHVRVQVVGRNFESVEFGNRGFLTKLYWKEHKYTDWLKSHLCKYDLSCVDTIQELNETEFSMTKEGLIHKKQGFFEKKDLSKIDDKHEWCIGFSSKERLDMLKKDFSEILLSLHSLELRINKIQEHRKNLNQDIKEVLFLANFKSFEEINEEGIKLTIDDLKEKLSKIETSSDTQNLKDLWIAAKNNKEKIEKQYVSISNSIAVIQNELKICYQKLEEAQSKANKDISQDIVKIIEKVCRDGKVLDKIFEHSNLRVASQKFVDRINDINKDIIILSNKITYILSKFSTNWPTVTVDWGDKIDSVDQYIGYLNKIEREGLPALVEEFKEKLNTEVTQSVACIVQKMDHELLAIDERIGFINRVLERAEFRENTFLTIVPKKLKLIFITEFEKNVKKVLGMFSSDDHEKRFIAISTVIETLQKALESTSLDSKRLLDPRLRVQFTAQELDKTTRAIRDVLDSSSGKSGGEKEAFAGSVVAASLAYVLTPDGSNNPVYSTVFLDEAFSNTSDAVSIRVLKIFRELKLHVNLITPFKNIDVARDYASSLIIISRNMDSHASSISELSWKEYDDQLNASRDKELESLGISVNQKEN